MSELSQIFRDLRGGKTIREHSKATGVPQTTLQKLENLTADNGQKVRYATVQDVAVKLKCSAPERTRIARAWAKLHMDRDFHFIDEPGRRSSPFPVEDFNDLKDFERAAILAAIQNPNLRSILCTAVNLTKSAK